MKPVRLAAGCRLPFAAVLLLSGAPVLGQPAPTDQIVVTGSRLPAGVRAPTPLTVLGSQAIEDRSPATIGEIFQQIPSFGEIDSPNTAGVTSRGGAQINPDLRGLGQSRIAVDCPRFGREQTGIQRVFHPLPMHVIVCYYARCAHL